MASENSKCGKRPLFIEDTMALQVENTETWEQALMHLAHAPLENWTRDNAQIMAPQPQLERAYTYCAEVTLKHSHTFYMASALLPREQRRAVRALYAFCRVSDDIIDRSTENRMGRFQQWRQRSLMSHPPQDDLVAAAWADTRARFQMPHQYAEQLLDGVARDLEETRYESFADLASYCYGAASTVGLMSMHIVGYTDKAAIPYAVKLGVALQLTNILRDIGEDWARGRLYLPLDELAVYGLSEAAIADQYRGYRWQAFMRFQIARTRRLYDEAMPGIALLEKRGRFAVAAAAQLYRGILTDIESHDYDVFTRRAHVSNVQKTARLPGIWWRTFTNSY
jgi:15-cis-phytoene synthase